MSSRPFVPQKLQQALIAGIGAALCISLIAMGGTMTPDYLGVMAPFGATMVILFALPQSPLAQPKNIIGGHLLTAALGLVMAHYADITPYTLGLAVGLGVAIMMLTGTLHPPAGANPLLIMLTQAPWYFFITPVLTGCLFIVAFGWFYHRFVSKSEYPKKQG
ncbi:HPP family protein [Marinomonas ostreistagni]|uniref:HPP family protein n=1 Tax=Marinomonas ostreistagni TaxID=359209 RepID=UPI0019524467|nr:HPP family protein [Marinomonas ostreistagni]MBM6552077.1 HPP family protein [Marinomonas ostreistagni]